MTSCRRSSFSATRRASALKYLTTIAKLPLAQAFKSLSTTGVAGLQKFLDQVGHIVARPIRLAFQVAFGKTLQPAERARR